MNTAKKLKIDRTRISLVHVAKKQLGLTEDEYRDALGSVGAASSKDLFPSQFHRLMDHFETMGFASANVKHRKPAGNQKSSRTGLREKLQALMMDLGLTDSYLDAIAQHMKFGVDRWQWASPDQMRKLCAALTYHKQRRGGNG